MDRNSCQPYHCIVIGYSNDKRVENTYEIFSENPELQTKNRVLIYLELFCQSRNRAKDKKVLSLLMIKFIVAESTSFLWHINKIVVSMVSKNKLKGN